MKVSIVIPVYYNEDNLKPLYEDLKKKFIDEIEYEYEIVMVNDGSLDRSYQVMKELAAQDLMQLFCVDLRNAQEIVQL